MWPFKSNTPEIKVVNLTATLTTKVKRKDYVVELQLFKHVITGQETIQAHVDNGNRQGGMIATEVVEDIWASEIEAMRQILKGHIAGTDIRKALIAEIKHLADVFKLCSPKEPSQGLEGYLQAEGYQLACDKVVSRLCSNQSHEQVLQSLRNREDLPNNSSGAIERLLGKWRNQGHERGCFACINVLELFEEVKKP